MLFKRLVPKVIVTLSETSNLFISVLTKEYRVQNDIAIPLKQIGILQSNLTDEIVMINKTDFFTESFLSLVQDVSAEISTPLTVGGGVSKLQHVQSLIAAGADKVLIGRHRINKTLVSKSANLFGSQSVICSVDYLETDTPEQKENILRYISKIEDMGFGELALNCRTRDGSKLGIDLAFLAAARAQTKLPVVAGCGIGSIEHIYQAFLCGADGVSLSTFLAKNDQPPKQIRAHLHALGIHIRTQN